jgi:FkbM family methyltransferase
MKLFLDVGAHYGETLPAVLDPRFGFHQVVCFEPAPECWPRLRRAGNERVRLCRYGLSSRTADMALYEAGSVRASVFGEAKTAGARPSVATFVRATDWFRKHVPGGATVYMKLNVEGSECDILDDLLSSGELMSVASTLVHFDVRRFPSQRDRERTTRAALDAAGYERYVDARGVAAPTTVARVQRWLRQAGAEEPAPLSLADTIRSGWVGLRYDRFPTVARGLRMGSVGRRLLPAETYLRMRSRLLGDHFRPRGS